jgi:hypothetical protein
MPLDAPVTIATLCENMIPPFIICPPTTAGRVTF